MRTGVVIAYNKDGAAKIIASGSEITKQRTLFRKLSAQASCDEGYERIEWYVTPHKVARRRPAVKIIINDGQAEAAPPAEEPNDTPKAGS